MKPTLTLSLTATSLVADIAPVTSGLLRRRARPGFSGAFDQGTLHTRLEQLAAKLASSSEGSLAGLALDVQLGQAHAHIGVMVLDGAAATILSASQCEAYAQAWVRQMLHLDPQGHLIRWQVLADAHRLLVSCIDRRVFDELNDFAVSNKVRFASCRPAILSAIARNIVAADCNVTIVWTEREVNAPRAGSIQLLRLRGKQICASWRGWVPTASASIADSPEVEGAVRRFQASNAAQGDAVKHVHWPLITAALQ